MIDVTMGVDSEMKSNLEALSESDHSDLISPFICIL